MDWKEFMFTVLAVTAAIVLAAIVRSKLPAALGGGATWEESYDQIT